MVVETKLAEMLELTQQDDYGDLADELEVGAAPVMVAVVSARASGAHGSRLAGGSRLPPARDAVRGRRGRAVASPTDGGADQ